MNKLLLFLCFTPFLFSCKKEKTVPPIENNFYQSNGNLIILKIGEDLESIYEFNLDTINLPNDSLPLYMESCSNGVQNFYVWKCSPNPDTLFGYSTNNFFFNSPEIDQSALRRSIYPAPFNPNKFQLIGNPTDKDYQSLWSKISNLSILKFYRKSNPNAKIGIQQLVMSVYNESFGVSEPQIKYFVYLVTI
jgi:hypothetical protein